MRTTILIGFFFFFCSQAVSQSQQEIELLRLTPYSKDRNRDILKLLHLLEGDSPELVSEALAMKLRANRSQLDSYSARVTLAAVLHEEDPIELAEEFEAFKLASAESLLKEAGPDIHICAIQIENRRFLEAKNKRQRLFDPTFLSNSVLVDKLEFSKEQRAEYGALTATVLDLKEAVLEEVYLASETLTEGHLASLNEILSSKQKSRFERLIGEPLQWVKLVESKNDFRYELNTSDSDAQKSGFRSYRPKGKDLEDLEEVDLYVYSMLGSEFFTTGLRLSEEQKEKLGRIAKKLRDTTIISAEHSGERFDELVSGTPRLPSEVSAVLSNSQEVTFLQNELQFRTGKFRFSFGLLHPQMVEELVLTNLQEKRIRDLSEEYRTELMNLIEESEVRIQAGLRESYMGFMKKLSDSQLRKYELITGNDTSAIRLR